MFNDTEKNNIYTLSLHDALPIYKHKHKQKNQQKTEKTTEKNDRKTTTKKGGYFSVFSLVSFWCFLFMFMFIDRKSTRLNSSHANISYSVFCFKKKYKLI